MIIKKTSLQVRWTEQGQRTQHAGIFQREKMNHHVQQRCSVQKVSDLAFEQTFSIWLEDEEWRKRNLIIDSLDVCAGLFWRMSPSCYKVQIQHWQRKKQESRLVGISASISKLS